MRVAINIIHACLILAAVAYACLISLPLMGGYGKSFIVLGALLANALLLMLSYVAHVCFLNEHSVWKPWSYVLQGMLIINFWPILGQADTVRQDSVRMGRTEVSYIKEDGHWVRQGAGPKDYSKTFLMEVNGVPTPLGLTCYSSREGDEQNPRLGPVFIVPGGSVQNNLSFLGLYEAVVWISPRKTEPLQQEVDTIAYGDMKTKIVRQPVRAKWTIEAEETFLGIWKRHKEYTATSDLDLIYHIDQ